MSGETPAEPVVLALVPLVDTPGKRDVTGAFLPEALKFLKVRGGTLHRVDNRKTYPRRAQEALRALRSRPDEGAGRVVAIFAHGTYGGSQVGFRAFGPPRNIPDLADALAEGQGAVVVLLYSCLNGRDDGFAEALSKALHARGKDHRIFAHTTAGHTTKNPYVVVYQDGHFAIPERRKDWDAWKQLLATEERFRLDLLDS